MSSNWFGCVFVVPFLRREGVLRIVVIRLPVSSMYTFCNKSKLNDIGGDTGEVISDLNGSLGSRCFLDVMNERTSFASCARAFKDPC